MTNDQKFQQFINDTDALLKALDKADETNSILHRDIARGLRKEMKVKVLTNRTVKAATPPPVPRKKMDRQTYMFLAR